MGTKQPLEREIKKQIADLLRWHGWEVQLVEPQKGYRWVKGLPDVWAARKGRALWIEVKRKGNKQSAEQIAFQEKCKRGGVEYVLAYTVEDVERVIDEKVPRSDQDSGGDHSPKGDE